MKIQNIINPSTENCTEEALYFRRFGDVEYSLAQENIMLKKEAMVSFDTYFNGFSASKWFQYTTVKKIRLKIKVKGKIRLTLFYKEKQMGQIYTQIVEEAEYDTGGKIAEIESLYHCEKTQGMYAFNILAMEDDVVFYGGEYDADFLGEEQKVRLAIVICTFKREEFVYKNIKMLKKRFFENTCSEIGKNLAVYISDNAKSLNQTELESEYVHIFPNKNVGGSGGFTRGLIECLKNQKTEEFTHVLLMDDDVMIQPESIFRTWRILTVLKPEFSDTYIGGAMLRLDKQWYQTESGALWNGGNLISRKVGLDLRDLDACLYNEFEEKCDFNAWWYCTIPMKFVNETNLPLPLFIRGDDVEYGLRNMKNLILMNGICVWHEPFEYKFSSSMYYYIFRNRLIDNAIHEIPYSYKQFLTELKEWFVRELFTYRFKNAQLLLDGANDFLKGIDWLIEQDGEALNSKVMGKGYKMQLINELEVPFDFPVYERTIHLFEGRMHQLKRKLLFNGMFLKAKGDAIVPTIEPHILYFYRKERVLNYDFMSRKGFVTYKNNKEFFRLYKDFLHLKKLCRKKYDIVRAEYRERGREVMNLEFWSRYLEIDSKEKDGENKS